MDLKRSQRVCALASAVVIEAIEQRVLFSGGNLDTGFSVDGKVTSLPHVHGSSNISATVVQSDKKVILAGTNVIGDPDIGPATYQFFVSRLKSDGTPDLTFGTGGTKLIAAAINASPHIALTSDGKILFATGSELIRLTAKGKYDTTFGGGDGVAFYISGDKDASIALRPDGKIIAAEPNGDHVRRFLSNGTLDTGFGSFGTSSINDLTHLDHFALSKVLRQSDGKILAVGTEISPVPGSFSNGQVAVARLNADGTVDHSYGGGDGVVTTLTDAGKFDLATSAVLQSNDKLLVVGNVFDPIAPDKSSFVIRYKTEGGQDHAFDGDGIRSFNFFSNDGESNPETATLIAVKSNGKIVVGGSATTTEPVLAVLQLKSNGSDDTGFATGGHGFYSVGAAATEPQDIGIAPDNKIIIAGQATDDFDTGYPSAIRLTA